MRWAVQEVGDEVHDVQWLIISDLSVEGWKPGPLNAVITTNHYQTLGYVGNKSNLAIPRLILTTRKKSTIRITDI